MTTTPASGRLPVDALCYECWVPQVSFHVSGCTPYDVRPILELPQCGVTAEAQYASDLTRLMIVIHVLGGSILTEQANPGLRRDHVITLSLGDAVVALEVRGPIPLRSALSAVAGPTVRARLVPLPLRVRFDLPALWTPLVAGRHGDLRPYRPPLRFLLPLVVIGLAFPAVRLKTVPHRAITREGLEWLNSLTARATLHTFRRHLGHATPRTFDSKAKRAREGLLATLLHE